MAQNRFGKPWHALRLHKRTLFFSMVSIIVSSSIAATTFAIYQPANHQPVITQAPIASNQLHALTQTSGQSNYTAISNVTPTNKLADQITAAELQAVLQKPSNVTSFTVLLLPVTPQNIRIGSLNFVILQQTMMQNGSMAPTFKTEFAMANAKKTADTIDPAVLDGLVFNENSMDQNGGSNQIKPTIDHVFATNKFSGLANWITSAKFAVVWKQAQAIKDYILSNNNKEISALDVWHNFLENSSLPPLQTNAQNGTNGSPSTQITISKVNTFNNTTFSNESIFRVQLTFSNTQNDDWQSGMQPNSTETIRYFGGFNSNNANVNRLRLVSNANLSTIMVPLHMFFGMSTNDPNNQGVIDQNTLVALNSLLPSKVVAPFGGNSVANALFVSPNQGLDTSANPNDQVQIPILQLQYNNLTLSFQTNNNASNTPPAGDNETDSPLDNDTAFFNNVINKNELEKIEFIPADRTGALQLVVYFKGWDVYSGTVQSQVLNFFFNNNTFATNPNGENNFLVAWKSNDELINMHYSHDVINEYFPNRNNPNFARLFTNRFLNATNDVFNLPRTVEINYGDDSGSESNGLLLSNSQNASIKIKLTFDNFSINNTNEPLVLENTYNLTGYQYDGSNNDRNDNLTIAWQTNAAVLSNQLIANLRPTDLVLNLFDNSNQLIPNNLFFQIPNVQPDQYQVTYLPNDREGTIIVYIRSLSTGLNQQGNNTMNVVANNHLYQQMFTGFRQINNANAISTFAFLPQIDVDPALLAIPLKTVTKQNVIDLYLSRIPLFQNRILNSDDADITLIDNQNDLSLTVRVTIPTFNQDDPGISVSQQTFVTNIKGFTRYEFNNETVFNAPKDLTKVIGIGLGTFVTLFLGVIFVTLILKRSSIKPYNKLFKKKNAQSKGGQSK